MTSKKLVLTLLLVICLIGAVNAAKNIDDFIVPSDYHPLTDTFPSAHEGTYSSSGSNSGLVIMKYGEEDEDIEMYLESDGKISYIKNDDNTYYFTDESTYSHGIYEVFEVDGDKFFANFWFSNDNSISDDEIKDIVLKFNKDNGVKPVSFSPTSPFNSMSILSGHISTGNVTSDQTDCSVYVGSEHAGENVKISVLYSKDGSNLNQGNIIPKTVDSKGFVSVPTLNALLKYPDKAKITIYDSDEKELDTKTVSLSSKSGSQSF